MGCAGAPSQTLDLRADNGMRVTVRCSVNSYTEGGDARRIYLVDAVACNGAGASCPDNGAAVTVNYVERKRQLLVSD